MAEVRFCSLCGSKMDVRDQFCINCRSKKKKKSTENEKEKEKAVTNTTSLK